MGLLKVLIRCLTGALVVRVCHTIQPVFDDPNLVAFGGLPAVMRLAEQAGLYELVEQHLTLPGTAGANAAIKRSHAARAATLLSWLKLQT